MSHDGKSMFVRLSHFAAAVVAFSAFSASAAAAQDAGDFRRWAVSVNATQVFVHGKASHITLGGGRVPGSDVSIDDVSSATVDVGYFFTPNVAGDLFLGVPPTAKIDGAGSIGALGALAEVDFGPVILSAQYHFNGLGQVHPYLGLGVGRIVFLNKNGRALTDFHIEDSWAPAVQAGVRYDLNPAWMLNADIRYVPFSTDASGSLGGVPVQATLHFKPILANVGLTYRF
jgi:outer membrane protein